MSLDRVESTYLEPGFHEPVGATGRSPSSRKFFRVCLLVLWIAIVFVPWQHLAWAHAFIDRSEPRDGATLAEPPSKVRILFDSPIESLFASIRVENGEQQRVDKGNGRVIQGAKGLLEVGLPPLPRGRYRVFWSVISRDAHRREGNFSFLIK